MKCLLAFLSILFTGYALKAQVNSARIDVIDYEIEINLSDSTNRIKVVERIHCNVQERSGGLNFDLVAQDDTGRGMKVDYVLIGADTIPFKHINDQLQIDQSFIPENGVVFMELRFSGIPVDGLIISQNKFGDRTFFGDNWPDRAHNWFACVDHPSDKATVSFEVQAPKKYDVVAVGELLKVYEIGNDRMCFFKSNVPLPTKVMVVGIADFSFDNLFSGSGVPISNAIYSKESPKVHEDMKVASDVLDFLESFISRYEFHELENVQSTTRYGGMENAGCIFYDENAFNGRSNGESLIAHEISHQWFGNSATESDWQHIWLSEGFATYFANLYMRSKHGETAFDEQLAKDRRKVIQFSKNNDHPIVDTNYSELESLLNANSYEKGSWVLHMLHNELGDSLFKYCMKEYYKRFRLSNASTVDLQNVIEQVTGRNLSVFFNQWLYSSGHPVLKIEPKMNREKTVLRIEQVQAQDHFVFPLKILLELKNGELSEYVLNISERKEEFVLQTGSKVVGFKVDPETDLLFELVK